MWDEMAVRFHSNSSLLHWGFSSRACDARAFPGILHFLLSQPSHLASRRQYLRRFRKNVGDFLKNVGVFPKNVGDFSIFLVRFFCVGLTLFGKLSCHFFPFLMHFPPLFFRYSGKAWFTPQKSLLMRSPSILYKDFCEGCESKKCKIAVVCAHARV